MIQQTPLNQAKGNLRWLLEAENPDQGSKQFVVWEEREERPPTSNFKKFSNRDQRVSLDMRPWGCGCHPRKFSLLGASYPVD